MKTDRSDENREAKHQKLIEEELTGKIISAFFEVYNALGYGLLEILYSRAMEIALRRRGLRVDREFPIEVFFTGPADRCATPRHAGRRTGRRRDQGHFKAGRC